MNNNDVFKYQLMLENGKEKVNNFDDLKRIVTALKSLIFSIEKKDNDWNKLFMKQWWILEEYYSVICDNSERAISDSMIQEINCIRLIILDLIRKKIQDVSSEISSDL